MDFDETLAALPHQFDHFETTLRDTPIVECHALGGLWAARRVRLGAIPELVPSGLFLGPYWRCYGREASMFVPDGTSALASAPCLVCKGAWMKAWGERRVYGPTCSPDQPCRTPRSGAHCGLCRDATWYERVVARLAQAAAITAPGSTVTLANDAPDIRMLYVVQWLDLVEEGVEGAEEYSFRDKYYGLCSSAITHLDAVHCTYWDEFSALLERLNLTRAWQERGREERHRWEILHTLLTNPEALEMLTRIRWLFLRLADELVPAAAFELEYADILAREGQPSVGRLSTHRRPTRDAHNRS